MRWRRRCVGSLGGAGAAGTNDNAITERNFQRESRQHRPRCFHHIDLVQYERLELHRVGCVERQ